MRHGFDCSCNECYRKVGEMFAAEPAPTPEPRNLPCAVCGKSSTHDIHDKVVYSYAHEFEARTPETLRCKHGVWVADHCHQCGGETPSALSAAPSDWKDTINMRQHEWSDDELYINCAEVDAYAANLSEKLATAERRIVVLEPQAEALEAELARVSSALDYMLESHTVTSPHGRKITCDCHICNKVAALRTGGDK